MWWNRRKGGAKSADAPPPEPAVQAEPVPSHRAAFILLGLAGAAVASFGLAAIADVFVWSFFALVLTICVYPLRAWLERHGVGRGLATLTVILAVVLLLGTFVFAFFFSFTQFLTLLPQYADELESWAAGVGSWLSGLGFGQAQIDEIVTWFDPGKVLDVIGGVVGSAAGFVTAAVILLTMLLLMAMDSSYARTLVAKIYPTRPVLATASVAYTIGVRRYMVVTTLLGIAQGLINWIALVLLQVPGAALWGVLAFLCSFIPNVGYFIAIIPPIVFAALVGGWPLVIAVIVVYGVINAVVQSVVQPRVVGNAVALSQSITFFSVLFWAVVLGPMGAILAIPLTLLVRMLLVDSNPNAGWMREALGDFDEAKKIMDAEDAASKARRRERKAARG
ncbi:AI-2E family transporter [Agromyces sp. CFH 90414]|uniref:AI-2E family transporter n=1 Tax=Agromyces agglutinans TaxID=2662258 RepID=A0A6I2F4E3_9MICO|nr:AI-2E family transporter [Agromyces agglutinans]MRG59111.1 AI-2E family transporter [Agromyces agglutinans]